MRAPPSRDQGKNKPSTNRRPCHRDSDSQTKRVESFCKPEPEPPASLRRRSPFLSRLRRKRTQARGQAQSVGESVTCRLRTSKLVARARRRQVWLLKPCLSPSVTGSIRYRGEETGDEQGQNQRRGVSADSDREKQRQSRWRPKPSRDVVAKKLNSESWRPVSIHHRRLEDADHCRTRRFLAQVADAMGHIATVAQRLAREDLRRRSADLDLELAIHR